MERIINWRKFSRRSPDIHEWLILTSVFSGLLLLGRILVTGSIAYLFLPWNLFLGFIPYWLTGRMILMPAWLENKWKFYGLLMIWLLFIPNSFYIITDLFHLTHIDSAPKWYDLLMIFSFAWNGLLYGVISLRRIELLVTVRGARGFSLLVVFIVMWLCAFGIYIGRFLRFNSWDVITNPFSLLAEIGDMMIHPLAHGYAWGMTLVYGLFMTGVYISIRKLTEVFSSR